MSEGGRPSIYSADLAQALCSELAQGKSMRTVCKSEDMPGMTTVFRWLADIEEFREQYARAKEEAADAMVEEMLDIADDGSNDWMESNNPDNPGWKANGEAMQRSRLRVDTRKWLASKLKAKKYGDKQEIAHSGSVTIEVVKDFGD